ncbi:MAG TPA: threo-3-hydroxy-L-aspartate ammonia-lyase [Segeticoccus sp.]|uniref:threo-3-hydroxy-L-aspartate ammonia-lyase n=1 Tax=Segeticoccus sp. TaxID=2706531 RepID=UPI002D7FA5A1|nr:threo-3-hydroxy-L-aspartate ammonia-lyase [Segeticoccus sp.]HET8601849.1 threo-3-hydroxy-L-aspartate ammonia-lyase [Segeticoccus sp.]
MTTQPDRQPTERDPQPTEPGPQRDPQSTEPIALPTFADVRDAAERIRGHAHRTPVLTARRLDAELGLHVYLKCENVQRVGAFKFRGAFNAISRLDPQQRRAGVVAWSSGNHAQAVALAARLHETPATIVMPLDAPATKVAATKGYGAEVVSYDRYAEDRTEIGRGIAAERGATVLPPFDHPDIIAGQGTAALELFEETGPLDALLVPLGGGGLLSGSLLSAGALAPDCAVYGVEPEAGDDGRQALRRGELVTIATPQTIADGAQTPSLGELTFAIIRERVTDILTATDDELVEQMRMLAATFKTVAEPTGCLGLAALRHLAPELAGKRVGVIVSGGNVDLDRYAALLTSR